MKSTNVVMLKVAYKDFITFADRTVFPPFLSHELDIILTVAAKAYQTDAKRQIEMCRTTQETVRFS